MAKSEMVIMIMLFSSQNAAVVYKSLLYIASVIRSCVLMLVLEAACKIFTILYLSAKLRKKNDLANLSALSEL